MPVATYNIGGGDDEYERPAYESHGGTSEYDKTKISRNLL
jgi:hypothetical protein